MLKYFENEYKFVEFLIINGKYLNTSDDWFKISLVIFLYRILVCRAQARLFKTQNDTSTVSYSGASGRNS